MATQSDHASLCFGASNSGPQPDYRVWHLSTLHAVCYRVGKEEIY